MRGSNQGFSFIELVLVIALIAILAAASLAVVNPAKRFKENRNAQRTADVNAILNATYQYYVDNNGTLPTAIQTVANCFSLAANTQICKTGVLPGTCSANNLVQLTDLTNNEKYLSAVPIDPTGGSTNGTGYYIVKNINSRITVCAPSAEGNTVSISR